LIPKRAVLASRSDQSGVELSLHEIPSPLTVTGKDHGPILCAAVAFGRHMSLCTVWRKLSNVTRPQSHKEET